MTKFKSFCCKVFHRLSTLIQITAWYQEIALTSGDTCVSWSSWLVMMILSGDRLYPNVENLFSILILQFVLFMHTLYFVSNDNNKDVQSIIIQVMIISQLDKQRDYGICTSEYERPSVAILAYVMICRQNCQCREYMSYPQMFTEWIRSNHSMDR